MKKLFILFTVLLVLGSSCKKDFLSVDEKNPNNASAVPASFVLPAALNYYFDTYQYSGQLPIRLSMVWLLVYKRRLFTRP